MKLIAKVIEDNGYKIELIRPLRDIPFQLGSTVEIELAPRQTDLINMFNNLIDDETRALIFDKFNESQAQDVVGTSQAQKKDKSSKK